MVASIFAHIFPVLQQLRSSGGSLWSKLWMLSVALRCGNSGMDAAFLRKAEVVRSRSRKLNWQQILQHFCANIFFFTQCWPPCRLTKHGHHWPPIVSPWMDQHVSNCSTYMIHHDSTWSMLRTLEHELKMMRLADGELMSGQRGSRLSKWISATEEERQKLGLEEHNKIKYLDLDEIRLYICLF